MRTELGLVTTELATAKKDLLEEREKRNEAAETAKKDLVESQAKLKALEAEHMKLQGDSTTQDELEAALAEAKADASAARQEVARYQATLEATEAALSQLQHFVTAEETRWRSSLLQSSHENDLVSAPTPPRGPLLYPLKCVYF